MKGKALFNDNLISNISDIKTNLATVFSTENLTNNLSAASIEQFSKYLKSDIIVPILTDRETRTLIDAMFQNNLNLTLTAKDTFMHRNTLMYRIEKIKTKLGLDIRLFDDACILKNIIVVYEKLFNQGE